MAIDPGAIWAVLSGLESAVRELPASATETVQSLKDEEIERPQVDIRGVVTAVASMDMDGAPSNLSVQLSEDTSRHFSVDSLERYIDSSGDMTPIHYLVERFLSDKSAKQAAASAELLDLFKQLQPALRKAGLA